MPERIQRRRTRGWRLPENTVICDRSSGWGNPYRVDRARYLGSDPKEQDEWWVSTDAYVWRFSTKEEATEASVRLFRAYAERGDYPARARRALRGKNLCCWCKPDSPCHVDVLLEIANAGDAP